MLHCKTCNKIFFNYIKLGVKTKFSFDNEAHSILIERRETGKRVDPSIIDYGDFDENDESFICPNQLTIKGEGEDEHCCDIYHDFFSSAFAVVEGLRITDDDIRNIGKLTIFTTDEDHQEIDLSLLSAKELMKVYQILFDLEKFKM